MNSKAFKEATQENLTILHLACIDDKGLPFIQLMSKELPYFKELVNDDSNPDGWTPLMWAAQKCNIDTVQELIA